MVSTDLAQIDFLDNFKTPVDFSAYIEDTFQSKEKLNSY